MDRLRSFVGRLAAVSVLGLELPLLGLWFVLATIVALVAEHVGDWNDMTDELVWERLAVSVGQGHSILPTLHGQVIRSLSQLYPLLVSPFFWHGDVAGNLRNAHIFNAWLMTSAAIPAFLLARRVTGARWPAYALAFVTVCLPWLVYSTSILTEVAAYPAFVWAAYGMHRTLTAPSKRNDLIALLTVTIAFFARTQFSLLLAVLPCAVVLYSLTGERAAGQGWMRRSFGAARDHVVLAGAYAVLLVGAAGIILGGHGLSRLSVYANESHPHLLTAATAGALTGHAADLAFGVGILPFVVGSAWLLANVVRPAGSPALHAFACLAATTVVVLLGIVAAWDLTLGTFVLDRYLFYLTPLLVLGFLCALRDARRPLWSLALPAGVVCFGFATHLQQSFLWSAQFPLSFDSPIAQPYHFLESLGGGRHALSAILIGATLALTALFVAATRLLPTAPVTAALCTLLVVAAPLDTALTFEKLFSMPGHSGRPLTHTETAPLEWLDQTVGSGAHVTAVPYPVSSYFRFSQQFWRDLEFWNKSIRYDVHYPTPDVYDDAVVWFPNTALSFDPQTGAASRSWSPYVVQSLNETRFRISGNEQAVHSDVMLIDAQMPWRTDWLTFGLYDDGWMRPRTTARIRVFASPGQAGPVTRTLSIQIQAPAEATDAAFTLASNAARIHGTSSGGKTTFETLALCVPAHGFAEASLSTSLVAAIPGDQRSQADSALARTGGLQLADLSLSDDLGPSCTPGGSGGG